MKYYCENCGTEIYFPKNEDPVFHCPVCFKLLTELPTHETVAQWEERKGKEYPGTAPVWLIQKNNQDDRYAIWRYEPLKKLLAAYPDDFICVVATEAGAPPDDWRPE
jgi:hypothetical protein